MSFRLKMMDAAILGTCFLACALRVAAAQDPNAARHKQSRPPVGFSLATDDDARYLRELQQAARDACAEVLEAHARREPWDDTAARRAADTLWTLHVKDKRSLRAMCKNLALSNNTMQRLLPLESFDVAHAIIGLGGSATVEGVLESLDAPLSRHDFLLRAHVLQDIDEREVILIHVRHYIKDVERKAGAAARDKETHLKNLRQVEALLKEPNVLNALENWPSLN
jgi:hypothetical protein